MEGLEFKVALGDTWKENLTELSGGQRSANSFGGLFLAARVGSGLLHPAFLCAFRSLVALSLILAMLLFKPAPIYILDEVDAALDLSHTQNIGQMLRGHFRHSQVRAGSPNEAHPHSLNRVHSTHPFFPPLP